MKSLNEAETPVFFVLFVFFVSKGNLYRYYLIKPPKKFNNWSINLLYNPFFFLFYRTNICRSREYLFFLIYMFDFLSEICGIFIVKRYLGDTMTSGISGNPSHPYKPLALSAWTYSADDKLMIFPLYFLETRV